jgi:hypothetical protein
MCIIESQGGISLHAILKITGSVFGIGEDSHLIAVSFLKLLTRKFFSNQMTNYLADPNLLKTFNLLPCFRKMFFASSFCIA